jgi:hypothetical protein
MGSFHYGKRRQSARSRPLPPQRVTTQRGICSSGVPSTPLTHPLSLQVTAEGRARPFPPPGGRQVASWGGRAG